MLAADPKFPWCTGAPRPVLLSCADSGDCQISYYTAPVVSVGETAVISFRNVEQILHVIQNDDENALLIEGGAKRDMICSDGKTHFLMFHNEYFSVVGELVEERIGGSSNSSNVSLIAGSEIDRLN